DCGSGHSHGDTFAFGLHTGHPANLSWAPRLGAFRDPAGACGVLLLFEATRSAMAACRPFLKIGGSTLCREKPNSFPLVPVPSCAATSNSERISAALDM